MLDPNFNPAIRVRGLHNRFGAPQETLTIL